MSSLRAQGGGGTLSSATDRAVVDAYRAHAPSLLRLARVFVDHRDAAEDIVQESFIRFARAQHRLEDPTKVAPYLRSIVLNLARDHHRRGLLSIRHQSGANDLDPDSVEEQVADRDEYRRVVEAVRRLPRRQRDCVSLRYLLELSLAETAATLRISENSVKTHVQRALKALRAQLDDPTLDDPTLEEGTST